MRAAMHAAGGSVFGDDWELRVTGRALREDLGLPDGARAQEHSTTPLGAVLTARDLSESLASEPESLRERQVVRLTGDGHAALAWQDCGGTFWILAVAAEGELDAHALKLEAAGRLWPVDRDAWRQRGDELARWIDDVRIGAPLLHLRAREDGGRLSALELDRGELALEETDDALYVGLRIGMDCSPRERSRLTATAVAAVRPVPGWEHVDGFPSQPAGEEQLVYRLPKVVEA
jgi:hypothetical protein